MTVSASDIAVGKCYATGITSEVRRVVAVSEFEVRYQLPGEGSHVTVSREKFAAEVDREVGCP